MIHLCLKNYRDRGNYMSTTDNNKMAEIALQTIASACQLPIVRVSRDNFLREEFKNSKHLDVILKDGPQAVYTIKALRLRATRLVDSCTKKTALASFVAGESSNCSSDYHDRYCSKYGLLSEFSSKDCLFIRRR